MKPEKVFKPLNIKPMKNNTISNEVEVDKKNLLAQSIVKNSIVQAQSGTNQQRAANLDMEKDLTEILFITSYPPRECGIATYSQDLIKSLNNKFSNSLSINVCALETEDTKLEYPKEVIYKLNTSLAISYKRLAYNINRDNKIKIVLIQHEFGFFKLQELAFLQFLFELSKPVVIVFHTVIPLPEEELKTKVKNIAAVCNSIVVMTQNSARILRNDYGLAEEKITVIAHGTHLVPHLSKEFLKKKYRLMGRKVLSTFGLLSSGKSIETTLEALPAVIKQCPDVVFLVIGKTHPEVVKHDGEKYREMLEDKVEKYGLQNNVIFINSYLALPELLEYLQLTDIYLFTTNDPNQAVSGTFAYAMSCACPIISTPIPHAKEVLTEDTGIIFDFRNSQQLADAIIRLLSNETLRKNISTNTLQKIVSTAWENSAVEHAMLFKKMSGGHINLQYNLPEINMDHLKHMTNDTGVIQFSKINQPDIHSGYTLDDNARALIAVCMNFERTKDRNNLSDIRKYLNFIKLCQQPDGSFLNYVDQNLNFTNQNKSVNLDDSNGRAIWALGYLVSLKNILTDDMISEVQVMIKKSIKVLEKIHSTRAMAFAIKGLYYSSQSTCPAENIVLLKTFATRLLKMYEHESSEKWEWFEDYLTYANSIMPEAMLYAWQLTGEIKYKNAAVSSFNFLLSQIFNEKGIEVISNKNWFQKGKEAGLYGEQPIDVAYTILTLSKFFDFLKDNDYKQKMNTAFNWFLGKNRLHQIIYNPCTGGCYDGLEESNVNLNQGAESTLSYLMARLTVEKYQEQAKTALSQLLVFVPKTSTKKALVKEHAKYSSMELEPYYFCTNSFGITKKEMKAYGM